MFRKYFVFYFELIQESGHYYAAANGIYMRTKKSIRKTTIVNAATKNKDTFLDVAEKIIQPSQL